MTERGSFTVEAALVIPIILLVAVAALEVTAVVMTHQELVAAAREGARVAATVPDPTAAAAAVRAALPEELARTVAITVRRPSVVGERAEVVLVLAKPLVTPLLDIFSISMRARAVMRVEL